MRKVMLRRLLYDEKQNNSSTEDTSSKVASDVNSITSCNLVASFGGCWGGSYRHGGSYRRCSSWTFLVRGAAGGGPRVLTFRATYFSKVGFKLKLKRDVWLTGLAAGDVSGKRSSPHMRHAFSEATGFFPAAAWVEAHSFSSTFKIKHATQRQEISLSISKAGFGDAFSFS